MKAYSNITLPFDPQIWKYNQYIYYFNHVDNGEQSAEKQGQRYEADFTIINSLRQEDIEYALKRSMVDEELEKCVVDNIEVEGKQAIEVIKEYNVDSKINTLISAILVATPIKIIPIDVKPIPK